MAAALILAIVPVTYALVWAEVRDTFFRRPSKNSLKRRRRSI